VDRPLSRPAEQNEEPRLNLLGAMRTIERSVHREMLRRLVRGGYPGIRVPHIAFLAHMTVEGRRLTEFAELMQVTKSAVSQLVTQLEDQGLVERVPDPRDGRAALIRATPAADRGFGLARTRLAQIEREWMVRLGHRRLDELAKALQELEGHEARRGSEIESVIRDTLR
jgi:DNA-binding MarR family transcriptional regulator